MIRFKSKGTALYPNICFHEQIPNGMNMQSFQARVVSVEERTPASHMVNNINKRNKRSLPNMTQTEPGDYADYVSIQN